MNTFSTLNVSFLIRKNRSNKLGEAPIYIRFSIDNERVEISTGRHIKPIDWNSKLNKAITKKKGAGQLNKFLDVLKNIGRGEEMCADLFILGYAPFCPWHNKSFIMTHPNNDFDVWNFYECCIAWLRVSDGMLVLSGWESSKGTLAEIKLAEDFKIPIFYSLEQLLKEVE